MNSKNIMNFLPKELESMIVNYKEELECVQYMSRNQLLEEKIYLEKGYHKQMNNKKPNMKEVVFFLQRLNMIKDRILNEFNYCNGCCENHHVHFEVCECCDKQHCEHSNKISSCNHCGTLCCIDSCGENCESCGFHHCSQCLYEDDNGNKHCYECFEDYEMSDEE